MLHLSESRIASLLIGDKGISGTETMMPKGTTLNPNAPDYIPIKRRLPKPEPPCLPGSPQGLEEHFNSALNLNTQAKNPHFLPQNPRNVNEEPEQIIDGHFEMCMEYLKMQFPCYSEKSLTEAYVLHEYDLETTEDMLNELESQTIQYKMVIVDDSGSSTQAPSSTLKLKGSDSS